MGGQYTQTQAQSSITEPWKAAQPMLQGILGQLNTQLPNTGATGAQGNAIAQMNANNAQFSSFAPSITGITSELLAGGGANNQAGNVNAGYQRYVDQTNPLASNTNYDPYSTPGFSDAINTMRNDITNQVNGSFAAAGRDFSGANFNALGRGIASGIAPTIASQYNQNVQNQQGAAGNLYNAGNTNAGILSGLQQQSLANKQAGVGSIGTGLDASNAAARSTIEAEAQRLGIPLQNLGLLANIGIPIAGLGGQSSGTSTTTQQMSPVQQFAMIANGISNLMPRYPIKFGA
jgi:hypothetical protein